MKNTFILFLCSITLAFSSDQENHEPNTKKRPHDQVIPNLQDLQTPSAKRECPLPPELRQDTLPSRLTSLPPELMLTIFRDLRGNDLIRLMRSSQNLNKLVARTLTQVTSLSIIHGGNNDNPYSLFLHPVLKWNKVEAIMDQTFIIKFLCQHLRPDLLKTLDLSDVDTAFLKLFKRYVSIEVLTLNLTDTYSLNQIRSLFPNLGRLELTYSSDTEYDFSVLQQLATCSQLILTEYYEQEWVERYGDEDELQLPKTQDFDVLSKMPGLRYLKLSGIYAADFVYIDTFPGLETLIIRRGGFFDPKQYNITETYFDEVAADIRKNNPTLRTLIFDGPNFRHQWDYPE